jgi:hypothetical protein
MYIYAHTYKFNSPGLSLTPKEESNSQSLRLTSPGFKSNFPAFSLTYVFSGLTFQPLVRSSLTQFSQSGTTKSKAGLKTKKTGLTGLTQRAGGSTIPYESTCI